ncbi:MAG: hypothetical protein ACLPKB_09215 [Xanthobacteraceae bacterium]
MHRRQIIVGQKRASAAVIVALVALASAVAGCSANLSSSPTLASNTNGGYPDKLLIGPGGLFDNSAPPVTTAALSSPEGSCPVVSIRDGAGTMSVDAGAKSAGRPRYEGLIGSTLRECATLGDSIRMKVAVHGHLMVRSAGRGGQVEIPIRYTIVQQGPEPKTIVSKQVRVAVTITRDRRDVDFSSIADDLIIPATGTPAPGPVVVYVGFDAPG